MKNFTEHQEPDSAQQSAGLKVIERGEARKLGLKRYFTGRPCIRGHLEERITSSNTCCGCSRERARKDKERRSDYFKEYYKRQDYKDRKKILVKKPKNREQTNKRAREHYHENKKRMRENARAKYHKMTEEQRDLMRKTRREKRSKDEKTKIIQIMRGMVFRCLRLTGRKKSTSTEPLLKYTKTDLVKHLESLFKDGMSWENHGTFWEIDHTMPVSYCVNVGITDPSIINQLDNLSPMIIAENRAKSDKPPIGISINGIKTYWGENE